MKPIYWNFRGWINESGIDKIVYYVAMLTPHFLERMAQRKIIVGNAHMKSLVPNFWKAGILGRKCGAKLNNSYVFFRKEKNKKNKYRLVFITVTPKYYFNTQNSGDAIEVQL